MCEKSGLGLELRRYSNSMGRERRTDGNVRLQLASSQDEGCRTERCTGDSRRAVDSACPGGEQAGDKGATSPASLLVSRPLQAGESVHRLHRFDLDSLDCSYNIH